MKLCITDEESLPREDIGTEHTADDVAQVRDVVDIGQGTGDQNVPLPRLWQTRHNNKHIHT